MDQLNQDQNNVTMLTNQLALIAQANQTLSTIQNSTLTMGQELQGFSDIWSAVTTDCHQVAEYITFLNTSIVSAHASGLCGAC